MQLVRQLADDDRLAARHRHRKRAAGASDGRGQASGGCTSTAQSRRWKITRASAARSRRRWWPASASPPISRLCAREPAQSAARHVQARTEETRLAETVAEAGRRADAERLSARIREGAAAHERRETLARGLAGNLMTPLILDRVEAEVRAIALLEDRIKASAPIVEVTIEPHATAPVLVDGRRLGASKSFRPVAPLTLTIPGIAAIRVSPPIDAGEDLRRRRRGASADAHRVARPGRCGRHRRRPHRRQGTR